MSKKGMMAQEHSNSSSGNGSAGGGGNKSYHHHHHNSYGGGSNNRSQKKMKQKKVPQRGLGVAQLEKIRMEEQKKKGVVLLSPSYSSSCLSVQCPSPPTFRPSMITAISSSAAALVPLQPPSPSDLPSPNCLFRPTIPPPPNVDVLNSNPIRSPKSLNVGNGEMGWPAVPVPTGHGGGGGGNWPKVWSNGEYGFGRDDHHHHHHGFAYRPNMNLPFESGPPTPFMSIPSGLQRSHQFTQQAASSMMNISSGISPSSILNFQTEPPSNQNLCAGNNYTLLWPDDEKMVGMKRPYPFTMETPPAPAFHFKYTPCSVASVPKSEESTSCSNTCTVNTDSGICVIREGPLRSSALSEPNHTEIKLTENGALNGDFLSLAPPAAAVVAAAAAAAPHLSSQYAFANSGLPSQFNSDGNIPEQVTSKSIRPPFFSFFSAAKKEIGQVANSSCNRNGELGEKIDLSLKL